MITHELQQGTPEWHQLRAKHFTASEAPAVMGLSKYKTRAELLREKATGISKEVDAATQRRFDDGHAAEAATRSKAEEMVGEELYPAIGTAEIDGLPLLASFDGIIMLETVLWENKLWNAEFAAMVACDTVPDTHWPQLEHQLLVSGAEKVLFTVSDGEQIEWTWYSSQPERRAALIAAWKQFAADLAAYQHVEIAEKPKAETIMDLPALAVQASGMVTYSNLPEFKAAAEAYIANINTELVTDQHFADAEATVKFCKKTEETLEVTKKAILAQTASIDEVIRTVDHIQAQLRDKRLMLDKLVKTEKEARKLAMVNEVRAKHDAHMSALQREIAGINLALLIKPCDFGGAIKGLKSLASMHDALDTALANAKIEADAVAKDVRAKLEWFGEYAKEYRALFADLQQIIIKPFDDFIRLAQTRIAEYIAQEDMKREADRQRIEAAAREKAEREAAARLVEDQARIRAEERAKAQAEADAIAASVKQPRQIIEPSQSKRPSDGEVIAALQIAFGISHGAACDLIIEVAERMKVAA